MTLGDFSFPVTVFCMPAWFIYLTCLENGLRSAATASQREVLLVVQICQTGPSKSTCSRAGAVGLALHCDRVPFTLLSACKFSAALAFQPITAEEL